MAVSSWWQLLSSICFCKIIIGFWCGLAAAGPPWTSMKSPILFTRGGYSYFLIGNLKIRQLLQIMQQFNLKYPLLCLSDKNFRYVHFWFHIIPDESFIILRLHSPVSKWNPALKISFCFAWDGRRPFICVSQWTDLTIFLLSISIPVAAAAMTGTIQMKLIPVIIDRTEKTSDVNTGRIQVNR